MRVLAVAGSREVVHLIVSRYPAVDEDLLMMGAFLHDLGKVEELSCDKGFAYTDAGLFELKGKSGQEHLWRVWQNGGGTYRAECTVRLTGAVDASSS